MTIERVKTAFKAHCKSFIESIYLLNELTNDQIAINRKCLYNVFFYQFAGLV